MAFKSTPCTCTASALAVFIRRIAYIDLDPTLRHTSNITLLPIARRTLTTFHPLQSQGNSPHQTVDVTSYATADIEDSIPYDPAGPNGRPNSSKPGRWQLQSSSIDNPDPEKWAVGDLEMKHSILASDSLPQNVAYEVRRTNCDSDTSSFSKIRHKHKEGPGFLELNPGMIDALAAKSAEDEAHSKSYAPKPTWEARPNSLKLMKRFRLHYSSPLAPMPKSKEVKKPDTKASEARIPGSGASYQRRYPVTEREPWQIQKAALKEKFKEGWNPRKKLSPDALAGIRAIHAQFPEQYTTSVLAEKFEVSPEAIRRILKSQWTPKEEEALNRQRRWFIRGQKVWSRYSELGLKPPARWRELGIGTKGKYTSGRRQRESVDKSIITRSADHAVRASDKNFSSTPASMAERIL